MSACSFFTLMNHNPTFTFKFVTTRNRKGVKGLSSAERLWLCFDKLCAVLFTLLNSTKIET